jgi:hypothetical protein
MTWHAFKEVDLPGAVSGTRKVLFAASKETPLETHCYSVQLDAANSPVGEPTLLTSAGSTHVAGDSSLNLALMWHNCVSCF